MVIASSSLTPADNCYVRKAERDCLSGGIGVSAAAHRSGPIGIGGDREYTIVNPPLGHGCELDAIAVALLLAGPSGRMSRWRRALVVSPTGDGVAPPV